MIYIPSHVQIEPVNRFCDARCPMCTIKFVPDFIKKAKDGLSNNENRLLASRVMNGIAYDEKEKRLWLTGKQWGKVYA